MCALPLERFKDSYVNHRWNPFTDTDMAVDAEEDGLIIPSGSPFIIQLLEQPRYNDPTQVAVRCYGVDTFVDETSGSGQPVLKVDDTAGFSPGDTIIINRGGDREEERIIDTIQAGISLTVTVNLEFEHTAVQADVVEKYIAFTETAGAPAQSQFRVDYPPGDGGEGTGLVEFNSNDADKEVRVSYKATGSPALAETLDTKVSYPAGSPGEGKIIGFIGGVPQWKDNPEPHVLASDRHTDSGLTIGHVIRASGAAAFAWAQLQHGDLGGVGVNDHHPQAHTLASHSSKAHSELTGIGSGDHHPQAHTLGSHSDFSTYMNQAVKTTSTPTFNNLILSGDAILSATGNLALKATGGTGNVVVAAPTSGPPACDTMFNNSVTFELDEIGHNIYFKVKYSNGTLKVGSVSLS